MNFLITTSLVSLASAAVHQFLTTINGPGPLNPGLNVTQTQDLRIFPIIYGELDPQLEALIFNNLKYSHINPWYDVPRSFAPQIGRPFWDGTSVLRVPIQPAYGFLKPNQAQLKQIIFDMIDDGFIPLDENIGYLVLNDPRIPCWFPACAYHDNYVHNGVNIREMQVFFQCNYGQLGNSDGLFFFPNGYTWDIGVSNMMHEITETMVDPVPFSGTSWRNSLGSENGDMCSYVFGKAADIPGQPSFIYNMQLGDQYYMVQQQYFQNSASDFGCSNEIFVVNASVPTSTSASVTTSSTSSSAPSTTSTTSTSTITFTTISSVQSSTTSHASSITTSVRSSTATPVPTSQTSSTTVSSRSSSTVLKSSTVVASTSSHPVSRTTTTSAATKTESQPKSTVSITSSAVPRSTTVISKTSTSSKSTPTPTETSHPHSGASSFQFSSTNYLALILALVLALAQNI